MCTEAWVESELDSDVLGINEAGGGFGGPRYLVNHEDGPLTWRMWDMTRKSKDPSSWRAVGSIDRWSKIVAAKLSVFL